MSDDKGLLDRLRTQWVANSTPPKPLLSSWREFSASIIGNPEPAPASLQEPQVDYETHRNRHLLNSEIRLKHVGFSRLNNPQKPKNVNPEAYAVFESKSGQTIPLTMADVDSLDLFIFNPENVRGIDVKKIEALKSDLEIARDQMDAGLNTMVELGYTEKNLH
ncbi:MAG: hypothetical protein AB8B83_05470 [Bdellovibrionales bacterium]